ncbi:MAG: helix-turn-helix domain-containing protein [Kiritimatiellae bacterium]|nr:helix-turn-helix domain-containing protein [Kiritimatiellia bacterium]
MKEIVSYGRFRCPELTPHKNKGMEITYIEKGTLEWMVEGVQEKIEPGSVYFTLPWQVHGSVHPREPDNRMCHILFHLEEDYPRAHTAFRFPSCLGFSASEMRSLSTVFSASTRHCYLATPGIRWLMPALIHELQSAHELDHAHTVTLLRGVIVELKRIVAGEAADTDTHGWSESRVQHLLAELSTHCDQRWTLKEMAGRCGVQRTRLNSIFQKLTACTPMEYLARLRIERAKTQLRETDLKVIDIAFACGFGSSQYFANTFRHATGMTPSEYRRHCAGLTEDELRRWRTIDFRSEQEERRRVESFSAD